jgi:O-antigen ligase
MRERLVLGVVTVLIGYTCFAHGGVTPREWGLSLAGIAAAALIIWLPDMRLSGASSGVFAAPIPPIILASVLLIPTAVAIQLVPLPLSVLRAIDPARAELLAGLNAAGFTANAAPLSVAPSVTFAHLERLLAWLLMFFLARELGGRLRGAQWSVALPVLIAGSLEAALGVAQYFAGAGKATGTWVNPNHFAAFLHMSFPFAVILAAGSMRRKPPRVALACLLMLCTAAILFGALYSLSRMGLATILASSSLLALPFLLTKLRGPTRWLSLAGVLAILAYILTAAPGPLLDRFDGVTSDVRAHFWKEAISLAAAHPIFGCGLGTYGSAIQQFRNSAPLGLVQFAHNDYLQIVAEMGGLGAIPWFVFGAWVLAAPWRTAFARVRTSHRMLAAACAAALAAIAMDSLVDFNFYVPANMLAAAWIGGLGSATGFRAPSGAKQNN